MKVKLSTGEAFIRVWFGDRTTNIVVEVPGWSLATACVICSRKDNFSRKVGRKLVLNKLFYGSTHPIWNLSEKRLRFIGGFSKEDRRVIWQAVCPEFHRQPKLKYKLNAAFHYLIQACKQAASAPGMYWLEEQIKLAEVIQRIEGQK